MKEIFTGLPDDDLAETKLNGDPDTAQLRASYDGYDMTSHNGPHIEPIPGREPKSFIDHWRETNPESDSDTITT